MTSIYQRNQRFKRTLPLYRIAIGEWLWGNNKTMNRQVFSRWERYRYLERLIEDWEEHDGLLSRLFLEPPTDIIERTIRS